MPSKTRLRPCCNADRDFAGLCGLGVVLRPPRAEAQLSLISAAAAAPAATGGFPPAFPRNRSRIARRHRDREAFQGNLAVLLAFFFGAGLLLAFTPAFLPMIPILSGSSQGAGPIWRLHTFMLSLAYVRDGDHLRARRVLAACRRVLSRRCKPWVLGTFAGILSCSRALFGLRAAAADRAPVAFCRCEQPHTGRTLCRRLRDGRALGLIVGPCVAAPLAAALLYISQSRDVVLGGSALFTMALGMGVPLLAVGVSAGALLPKSGPWMETVKRFFGVMLLAVAIYLVSPLLPIAVHMLAWAVLLAITGIYLKALDPLPPTARSFERFAKGVGVLVLVTGVAFLAARSRRAAIFFTPAGFAQRGSAYGRIG